MLWAQCKSSLQISTVGLMPNMRVSILFPGGKASPGKLFRKNFQIVTLREATRGSAGVLVAKREAAGDTQSVQEMTM